MTIEPNQEQQDKPKSLNSPSSETTSFNSSDLFKMQENNFILYQKFVERTQWFLGGIITILSLVFIASVSIFGLVQWDFQKTIKADIEKEINERLGKKEAEPELEIVNANNQVLKDSEVRVSRIVIRENKTDNNRQLPFSQILYEIPITLKNVGDGNLDFLRLKFYSNDFEFDYLSSNNPKYRREFNNTISSGKDVYPLLVGGEIISEKVTLVETRKINKKTGKNQLRLPNGKYNILMVIIYPEKNKNQEINFTIVIDDKTEIIDFNQ